MNFDGVEFAKRIKGNANIKLAFDNGREAIVILNARDILSDGAIKPIFIDYFDIIRDFNRLGSEPELIPIGVWGILYLNECVKTLSNNIIGYEYQSHGVGVWVSSKGFQHINGDLT